MFHDAPVVVPTAKRNRKVMVASILHRRTIVKRHVLLEVATGYRIAACTRQLFRVFQGEEYMVPLLNQGFLVLVIPPRS